MTAYDLIYKVVTHLYLHNNAYAFLQKDERGNLKAIYPLSPNNVEYMTDARNEMYLRFMFNNGDEVTFHISDVLILRRFFNSNDLMGDKNNAIMNTLDLAHAQDEGMESSIKSSAKIRGILKYSQVMSPEKLKAEKDAFVNDYLSMQNNGGIAALDSKADYVPINMDHASIDEKQMDAVKHKIHDHLGINESIVN